MCTYVYSAHRDQWEMELQMVVSFREGMDTGPKSSKHFWPLSHLSSPGRVFLKNVVLKNSPPPPPAPLEVWRGGGDKKKRNGGFYKVVDYKVKTHPS